MTKRTIVMIKVILLLITILILGVYCFAKLTKHSNTVSVVSQSVALHEKKIEDKNDFYDISIVYPVEFFDKNNAVENFVEYKVNEKKEEWKVGGKAYIEEKQIEKDFPDRPKMVYQYQMMYKKYTSQKMGTVSYVMTTYEFTGGANGNTTITTFTFTKDGLLSVDTILDFNNNKDITLSTVLANAIIKRDGDQAAPDMVKEGLGIAYLKSDGKTLDKEKCHCDGFFFPSNFQNYVVEDDGLRFIFNKYQVAPGSAGTPDILLDWNTLKPYLLPPFKAQ